MEVGGENYISYPEKTSIIQISNFADLHLYNANCAVDKITRDRDEIKDDPNKFAIGGGDYADYITAGDKRFDPATISNLTTEEMKSLGEKQNNGVYEIFNPIRHKLLGLLFGNHELRYQISKEQGSLHANLCNKLKVRNLGYCCFLDLIFVYRPKHEAKILINYNPQKNDIPFKVRFFLHHGCGHAVTPGGKLNKLIQFMNNFEANVYMTAHVHDQQGRRQPQLKANDNCTDIINYDKIGVISGSYLKTYELGSTSYGEVHGYAPTKLGCAYVNIVPAEKEITGEI